MRIVTLFLLSLLPCTVAVASPLNTKTKAAPAVRKIRISLINFSVASRQVVLRSGLLDLPVATRVDIDTQVGATVTIVSATNDSLQERILIKEGDDARLIDVR